MSAIFEFAAFALTLACGWFMARLLTAGAWQGPRWTCLLVELSLGALWGPGLASLLFCVLLAAGAADRASVFGLLLMLLCACAASWWKVAPADIGSSSPSPDSQKRFPHLWVLWIAVAIGIAFFFLDFQATASANPAGEWDAISIWNLRARYLAAGNDFWRRAMSSELGGYMTGAAHPGYPLFLSGFVALQWLGAGDVGEMVPIAASFLFAAAVLLLLGASLASRRSVALGLLAVIVLLASEVFNAQAASQYSDLLQGLAFLSMLVLFEAADKRGGRRLLVAAGLTIGLSCWIKNEGLVFAIAALAVGMWRFRSRGALPLAIGAFPGVLAIAVFKLFFVKGSEAMFPATMAEMVAKIADAGRWWQALLGFGKAILDAGIWWSHPLLLAIILALAFRFVPASERRTRMWLLIPIGATAVAEYGLYLITTADLDWHVSTSVSRLVAQLWPSLIWLFVLLLRQPEDAFPAVQPVAASATAESSTKAPRRKRRQA